MSDTILLAKVREDFGKNAAYRYREAGYVLAEFYSQRDKNLHLILDAHQMEGVMASSRGLLELKVEGTKKSHVCVIKDIQVHPVRNSLQHVDLYGVKKGEKLQISVPVVLVGTPAGLISGGILEHMLRELDVEVLPKDLPDKIEVDVTDLDLGDSIHVSDLNIENVKILNDPEMTITLIEQAKKALTEEEETDLEEEEEVLEPEVITARKSDEE